MAVTWDLSSFFPTFRGPEMLAFRQDLERDLAALERQAAALAPLSDETAPAWEAAFLASEEVGTRLAHLRRYVGCLTSAHADREEYAGEDAALATLGASLRKADVDLTESLKVAPEATLERLLARPGVAPVAHAVRRMRENGRFSMPREQERLAADLSVDGPQAWDRLYGRLSGTMSFEMAWPDGRRERLPMSRWRALMADPDRGVGRAAFEGGNRAWTAFEDVFGAALNAMAGTRLTLNRYRGRDHFLDPALYQASIRRGTLDAMYASIRGRVDVARRIVAARARAMGRTGIAFYEREAPLPTGHAGAIPWAEGVGLVDRAFGRVYPALRDYFRDVLARRWVEAEARPGKRPGAFCTGSPLAREERVYMTYSGTLEDVRTLAHEVGHGWHSCRLRDVRPFARHYPMTLAETASTFAEQILAEGVIEDPSLPAATRLAMLDTELTSGALMLLDITVRFEFERRFHEERARGPVAVSRLKELMTETQREIFGDALEPGGEDPMFWASKLHFYISGTTFYNFPYTFGFLLTRAFHRRLQSEGAAFLPRYEEFLRLSGSAEVEEVVRRTLGEDVGDPGFWAACIDTLEAPLAAFERATSR